MAAPLRVALVGYGLAGRFFHAPLIAAAADLTVASVVMRDEERRAAARRDITGVQLLDGVGDLWDDAAHHDVAIVATPNAVHATVARAALEAGLHVVVDKPFTARADDARAVVRAAADHSRVLTVFHNR